MSKEKIDVQTSILNGFVGSKNTESFLLDLRDVLVKHKIESVQSDYMVIEEGTLVIRNSRFECKRLNNFRSLMKEYKDTNIMEYDSIFQVTPQESIKDMVDTLVEINTELYILRNQKEELDSFTEEYRSILHKELELLEEQLKVTKELEKHYQ